MYRWNRNKIQNIYEHSGEAFNAFKRIAQTRTAGSVGGVKVDPVTATAVITAHQRLSPTHAESLAAMPAEALAQFGQSLIKQGMHKESVNECFAKIIDEAGAVTKVVGSTTRKKKGWHGGYAWHEGHSAHYNNEGIAEAEEGEAHPLNPYAFKGKAPDYASYANEYGVIRPGVYSDLKFYPYEDRHTDPISGLVKSHNFEVYYMGGNYPLADLNKKNYDTGHLAIWDPTDGSGGDFGEESYTNNWRRVHELSHGLTRPKLNSMYGEARRMGKLGHQRTTHEAKRAVHWEWLTAHKQRDLNKQLGIHVSDEDFHRELNTVMHDAVYRAVTGKFTNPNQEGFHPHSHKVSLDHAFALIDAHAKRMGLNHPHETLKRRIATASS